MYRWLRGLCLCGLDRGFACGCGWRGRSLRLSLRRCCGCGCWFDRGSWCWVLRGCGRWRTCGCPCLCLRLRLTLRLSARVRVCLDLRLCFGLPLPLRGCPTARTRCLWDEDSAPRQCALRGGSRGCRGRCLARGSCGGEVATGGSAGVAGVDVELAQWRTDREASGPRGAAGGAGRDSGLNGAREGVSARAGSVVIVVVQLDRIGPRVAACGFER